MTEAPRSVEGRGSEAHKSPAEEARYPKKPKKGDAAAVEVQQLMFLHSLWHRVLLPRSLLKIVPSTVPIFLRRYYLKHALEPDVEHGVPVVQEVNVQETVLASC